MNIFRKEYDVGDDLMLPRLEEISKRRRVLGLTQKHLARLADVRQAMIAKIEAGSTKPS